MLSRIEDARVFGSSDDVILRSSSNQNVHHKFSNGMTHQYRHQQCTDDRTEDEQLHPQHPYRMRKRVLKRNSESFYGEEKNKLLPTWNQRIDRPMELVFLSSGEILAREDCPPDLELPKIQHDSFKPMNKELDYYSGNFTNGEESEYPRQVSKIKKQMKVSKQQIRRLVMRQQSTEQHAPLSSVAYQLESLVSKNEDVTPNNGYAEASTNAIEKLEIGATYQLHQNQKTTNDKSNRDFEHLAAQTVGKKTSHSSPTQDHSHSRNDDARSDYSSDKACSASDLSDSNHGDQSAPSDTTSHDSRRQSPPLQHQSQDTKNVSQRKTKQSPKMKVSHLELDASTPKAKDRALSSDEYEANEPASELQIEEANIYGERKQPLKEQDKNKHLWDQIKELEAQLAAKDSEMNHKIQEMAREHEVQMQTQEKRQFDRIIALEEQVLLQETQIARSKQVKDQLKAALKQLNKLASSPIAEQCSDSKEVNKLKTELDGMAQLIHEFLISVERWKESSIKEMQCCENDAELPALFEHKWLDFPQFPKMSTKESSSLIQDHCQGPTIKVDEQTDPIVILKKRLHQREDELRQTRVKYLELKELCARQCVREADLQNFINEHRLRGNLVIRKNIDSKPATTENHQEVAQDDHDEQQNRAKLKMISSRGTNTPACFDDDEHFIDDEYSETEKELDDFDEAKDDYVVQAPKVIVQVNRDGMSERTSSTPSAVAQKLATVRRQKQSTQSKQPRVERIRLIPSPNLTQRHKRIPTPTTAKAQKKKSSQQHVLPHLSSVSRNHPDMLGECPPGCGSRPSFMRRKPSTATRAKAIKRPISATSSRGAVGVIRPWM
ncbi:uncharacterized protein PHALS_12359 [Plasmopara halstedii]|uniref:Uncharacterized protein n=1 Tax=Plasmopara halstedii TaxID=4781 RepID=A0A0P1AM30_PLAHL|nr:uncharacterized protein PHALS_12359 [Plasmopara halstedii]CEG42053.1 hypothetical protein PHALS_12359 [Plasmopara halstedii]|eukprot:XP_024578422.1 hypothetical protein PHALS_12359 [Plasmopara halstedii]